MFRPFYLFIGFRYTHLKRKNHFISFISFMSILGIALGVGVLIAVLSVMNGFNREIRAQMLSGTPHLTVGKIGEPLIQWRSLIQQLKQYPNIIGAAPFVFQQGMLSSLETGQVQGILIRGIDPEQIEEVYPLAKHLVAGDIKTLKGGSFGVILGRTLAQNLGLRVKDKISLITPEASVTPAGIAPRIKRFTVVGIFKIGDLYDDKQVFIHLNDADKLFRLHGSVSGIQLKVPEELEAPLVAQQLTRKLSKDYWVLDWTQEFGNFFHALQIQKTVMSFILLLIIAVAAFNLVSSLVMMVTDKRADIAILRNLGASRRSIMGIFIAQGGIIGLFGTALGTLLGLFLATHVTRWVDNLEKFLNIELVSKEVYLIGFLPSEIHTTDVISIVSLTLGMCLIATLYPAWRAALIQPAEALRYE